MSDGPIRAAQVLVPGPPGPPGPQGKPGTVPIGSAPTAANFPMTGNTLDDVRIAEDTGHAHRWSGSTWIDIGQWRGDPGELVKAVADTYYAPRAATETALAVLTYNRYDAADYGAVRDSAGAASANVTAINAAAADALANGGVLVIRGTYHIDALVELRCHVDARDGELITTSTTLAPALRFGGTSANSATRRYAHLPVVRQTSHVAGSGWGTDIGIEVRSVNNCQIVVPFVTGFGVGLRVTSSVGGCSYNDIVVGHLHSNKINLDVMATSPGWANENRFSGPLRLSFESAEGANVAGTRHIRMLGYSGSGANNCTFYSPSIEANTPEYHVELTEAVYNQIIQARWEASPPKVLLDDASNNVFFYGYNAQTIVFTTSGTVNFNHIYTRNMLRIIGSGDDGVIVAENYGSSAYPAFVAMPSGSGLGANPATGYGAAISANQSKFKGGADAHPRVQINGATGEILMGSGTATPAAGFRTAGSPPALVATTSMYVTGQLIPNYPTNTTARIYAGSGTPEGSVSAGVGSLYMRTDGGAGTSLYVKESGTGSSGWVAK